LCNIFVFKFDFKPMDWKLKSPHRNIFSLSALKTDENFPQQPGRTCLLSGELQRELELPGQFYVSSAEIL
jgi:hypothetical protein